MRVSYNWLKQYLDFHLTPGELGELLTALGLEVEGVEEVQSIPGGLEGVFVGEVLECRPHPNADRLSVTRVDIGNGDPLPIVCGAPNVAAGQKVVVATVGTTLYPAKGDPLTLKKTKIRGEVSEGMICAEDELGLGHDHDGILVLPGEARTGTPAKDYFEVETDVVYEIGLTPNRSDATNHLGVARDLAAYLRINHDHSGEVRWPDVSAFQVENHNQTLEVEVEDAEACPRYSGLSLEGIRVKESPDWLKRRLQAVGVRPINNVVDATNFVLHELGQPLHAFDIDAIPSKKIVVKTLPGGTAFTTLDEVERPLSDKDLMICDGEDNGLCIAGVFGGMGSGVTEKTTRLFLESAHFDAKWIRRTSMRYNLRTDAAKVYEKGSDPNITVYALQRAALLIRELAGGTIASEIVDRYPRPIAPAEVQVRPAQVNRLLGLELSDREQVRILEAMDMEVARKGEGQLLVRVPTNKSDVTREADVIEEILRIYGYDKVPIPEKIHSAMAIAAYPEPNELRDAVSQLLIGRGFLEMMGLSLSESRYYTEGPELGIAPESLVHIHNTSNAHLDIMRPTMLVSGLEAIRYNQNRQQQDLKLFEFGKTYRQGEDGIAETEHLALFLTGARWRESWLFDREQPVTFYTLKAMVETVLQRLGLAGYQHTFLQDERFQYGLVYHRGPQVLAEFGQVPLSLSKAMDIRTPVLYADLHWETLAPAVKPDGLTFRELNRFPAVRRDLALVVDNSVKFQDIASIAKKHGKKLLKTVDLFDLYENEEQLGAGKKSYAVSFVLEHPEKTLKDKEVDKLMDKLIQAYEAQLGAVIRR